MSMSDFPKCADWKHVVADVKVPACPIKVSMPCIGVYGSKTCFSNVGAVCEPVNIFDLEDGYTDLLQHMTDGAELNLGEQRGDVLNVDLANLEDSHILLSGPPCPPYFEEELKKLGDSLWEAEKGMKQLHIDVGANLEAHRKAVKKASNKLHRKRGGKAVQSARQRARESNPDEKNEGEWSIEGYMNCHVGSSSCAWPP